LIAWKGKSALQIISSRGDEGWGGVNKGGQEFFILLPRGNAYIHANGPEEGGGTDWGGFRGGKNPSQSREKKLPFSIGQMRLRQSNKGTQQREGTDDKFSIFFKIFQGRRIKQL